MTRRGAGLRVTWKAARPGDRHEVRVRLGDGRRLFYRTRRNTITVPRVRPSVGARISVRGVLDSGMTGRPAVTRAKRKAG